MAWQGQQQGQRPQNPDRICGLMAKVTKGGKPYLTWVLSDSDIPVLQAALAQGKKVIQVYVNDPAMIVGLDQMDPRKPAATFMLRPALQQRSQAPQQYQQQAPAPAPAQTQFIPSQPPVQQFVAPQPTAPAQPVQPVQPVQAATQDVPMDNIPF